MKELKTKEQKGQKILTDSLKKAMTNELYEDWGLAVKDLLDQGLVLLLGSTGRYLESRTDWSFDKRICGRSVRKEICWEKGCNHKKQKEALDVK